METNGWERYQELVMYQLAENTKAIKEVTRTINEMKSDVSALKVKAALVGGVAGIIGTGLVTAVLTAFK